MPALPNRHDYHGPTGSSVLLRSYQKAMFWRRLILAGFFTVFAATILYSIPWLPYGLSAEHYDAQLTFLIFLILMATSLAFAAVYLRDLSNRVEQTMLTWNTVHDGLSDLRRREYFFDRVELECSRSAITGDHFAVVALRLEAPSTGDVEKIARAISLLESVVREYDCLSSLGPHEIAILAHGIGADEAPVLANNLSQFVAEAFTNAQGVETEVIAGYAVFSGDARDAGTLIGMARERLMRNRSHHTDTITDSVA